MTIWEKHAALWQEYRRILSERQYEVLWLREVEGLSGKEIAGRLHIFDTTVSRHLTRAKERIRKELAIDIKMEECGK